MSHNAEHKEVIYYPGFIRLISKIIMGVGFLTSIAACIWVYLVVKGSEQGIGTSSSDLSIDGLFFSFITLHGVLLFFVFFTRLFFFIAQMFIFENSLVKNDGFYALCILGLAVLLFVTGLIVAGALSPIFKFSGAEETVLKVCAGFFLIDAFMYYGCRKLDATQNSRKFIFRIKN